PGVRHRAFAPAFPGGARRAHRASSRRHSSRGAAIRPRAPAPARATPPPPMPTDRSLVDVHWLTILEAADCAEAVRLLVAFDAVNGDHHFGSYRRGEGAKVCS